jgi:hypothetical protein
VRALALILLVATTSAAAPRLRTSDPELVHGDSFDIRGFLQIHATELGGRADEREPLEVGKRLGFLLFDDQEQITGAAVVTRGARAIDVEHLGVRLTAAAAAQRMIGRKVTQTTKYGKGVPRDCRMGGGGQAACTPRVLRTTTRSVVVTADDVSASIGVRIVAGAPRLVVCVLVEPPMIERADVLDSAVAGFPATFDATTGAALALRPAHCL